MFRGVVWSRDGRRQAGNGRGYGCGVGMWRCGHVIAALIGMGRQC